MLNSMKWLCMAEKSMITSRPKFGQLHQTLSPDLLPVCVFVEVVIVFQLCFPPIKVSTHSFGTLFMQIKHNV